MAEKDSVKKRLVLLVIFVALSLIVDLLSLNVLNNINEQADSSFTEEELAASSPRKDCFSGCMDGSQHDCVDICVQGSVTECYCCEWQREESCRTDCGKSARRIPSQCK